MIRSLISWFTLFAVLVSAAFAVDRFLTFQQMRTELDSRTEELAETGRLIQAHSDVLGAKRTSASAALKSLVQQAGARNGIVLNNLGENERDIGEKLREHNVFSRMSNVPHTRLVAFLAELEAQGDGAKIKELRIMPDPIHSDNYKEVESTLSIRWSVDTSITHTSGTAGGQQ